MSHKVSGSLTGALGVSNFDAYRDTGVSNERQRPHRLNLSLNLNFLYPQQLQPRPRADHRRRHTLTQNGQSAINVREC